MICKMINLPGVAVACDVVKYPLIPTDFTGTISNFTTEFFFSTFLYSFQICNALFAETTISKQSKRVDEK